MRVAIFTENHEKYIDLERLILSDVPVLYKIYYDHTITIAGKTFKSGDILQIKGRDIKISFEKNVYTSLKFQYTINGNITDVIINNAISSFQEFIHLYNPNCQINFDGSFLDGNFTIWGISPYKFTKWNYSIDDGQNFFSIGIDSLSNIFSTINLKMNNTEMSRIYVDSTNTQIINAFQTLDINYKDEYENNFLMLSVIFKQYNLVRIIIDEFDMNTRNLMDIDLLNICFYDINFWRSYPTFILWDEIIYRGLIFTEDHLNQSLQNKLTLSDYIFEQLDSTVFFTDLCMDYSVALFKKVLIREYKKEENYERFKLNQFIDNQDHFILTCKFGDMNSELSEILKTVKINNLDKCLFYTLINNNYELAGQIIDKGVNLNETYYGREIEFFSENIEISRKITQKRTAILFSDNFSIIRKWQFSHVATIGGGTYGVVNQITLKSNQKRLIVKESNMCKSNGYISKDTIKEIYFLRKINSLFPNACGKIFGLIPNGICIDVVMEYEGIPLQIYTQTMSYEERKNQFVDLFRQILNCAKQIHYAGILHYDISCKNVLIKNGKIKLIDLGISKYYEIFPFGDAMIRRFPYIPWISMDNWDIDITRNSEISVSHENFKGLNYTSDVFSIGVLMCQYVYNNFFIGFYFDDNENLICRTENISEIVGEGKNKNVKTPNTFDGHKYKKTSFNFSNITLDKFYPNLLDLLKNMIVMNSEKRFTVDMVLNSFPFGENLPINIVKLSKYWEYDEPISYLLFRPERYDLIQITNMVNAYRDENVKVFNRCRVDVIKELMDKYRDEEYNHEVSDNSIFNCIFAILRYENFPDKSSSYVADFWLTFYRCIFDSIDLKSNYDELFEQMITKDITFTPVSLYVSYIAMQLELRGKNYIDVFELIYIKFIKFLAAVNYDFNVWNVISVIAKDIIEIDFFDLRNEIGIIDTIQEGDNILSYMDEWSA